MLKPLILIILLLCSNIGHSVTITIKQDSTGNFITIQAGINAASTGDTLLVWPGTYYENIDFIGKSITIASKMILTGDDSYKYNTIIDGNQNGSCVLVMSGEDNAVLYGLTIQNGSGFSFSNDSRTRGGGVYMRNASNTQIENCIIKNNFASRNGGGISCNSDNGLYLKGSSIFCNRSIYGGGGIFIGSGCEIEFDPNLRCSIYLNFAEMGCDLLSGNPYETIFLYLDTCTVLVPDNYFFLTTDSQHIPINNMVFDILNKIIQPWDGDLYVNPLTGDNNYSGVSPTKPLKSIAWAYSKIKVNESNKNTIHLADGIYSDSANNEIFPLNIRPDVDIVGENRDSVILDGMYKTTIAKGNRTVSNYSFSKMTMTRGGFVDYEDVFINNVAFIFCYRENNDIRFDSILFSKGWICAGMAGVKLTGCNNVLVTNCEFRNNIGEMALDISFSSSLDTAWVLNCKFFDNMPDYNHPVYRFGGGLEIGDGAGTGIVGNCLFVNNNKNGLIAFYNSYNYVINCTFVNNSLEQMAATVWAADSRLRIYNCINYNNGDYPLGVDNLDQFFKSELHVYNSLLENGEESVTVNNEEWCEFFYDDTNIAGDPFFLGGTYTPYNLSDISPCIDMGTLELPEFINLPEFDLAGNPRVVNGAIDMGAYEWNPTVGTQYHDAKKKPLVTAYPNPVYNVLYFDFSDQQQFNSTTIQIKNTQGQLLQSLELHTNDNNASVNTTSWPAGLYFYSVNFDKMREVGKFVVVR